MTDGKGRENKRDHYTRLRTRSSYEGTRIGAEGERTRSNTTRKLAHDHPTPRVRRS